MARRKRILLYGQHLTGVGHFVRLFEIARELAGLHDVWLVDGGRIVRRPDEAPFPLLSLPRIGRIDGRLAPLDAGATLEATMKARRSFLIDAIEEIEPEILVVEHFPFSKPELMGEILAAIEATRRNHRRARVVCSVRDVLTRRERPEAGRWTPAQTMDILDEHFDLVLAHTDPAFIPLDETVPWVTEIVPPLRYTGYVAQKLASTMAAESMSELRASPAEIPDQPFLVVSSGGCDGTQLVEAAIAAWDRYRRDGGGELRTMLVFHPPDAGESKGPALGDSAGIEAKASGSTVRIHPFSGNFLRYMHAATLSISHAGYNTCTNLMESRTAAVLAPSRSVSDQAARARRCDEAGLATYLDPAGLDETSLLAAMRSALASKPAAHELDLSGAQTTCEILEDL